MTAKEMIKKVFASQAIMVVVVIAIYVVARLLELDYEFAVLAAFVATFAALTGVATFPAPLAAADATATFAAAAAFAAFFADTPVLVALTATGSCFTLTAATAAITALTKEKDTTEKQKNPILASYLIEFALAFSAFQFVLPSMF